MPLTVKIVAVWTALSAAGGVLASLFGQGAKNTATSHGYKLHQ